MCIEIESVPIQKKSILRNLLELCQHDYSEFGGDDVGEDGLFGYKYLDHYWTESGRYAFFIRASGNLAGFALVCQLGEGTHCLSEFFILRKYRHQGIGTAAARRVFDMFPGKWKVEQEECNLPAQAFWRRVVSEYTGGQFEECSVQVNERWGGIEQRFLSPRKNSAPT